MADFLLRRPCGFSLVDGPASGVIRDLIQRYAPGYGYLHQFFSQWLRTDLTSLAFLLWLLPQVSSSLSQINQIATTLYKWITYLFTATVSLPAGDRSNREVLNWVSANVIEPRGIRTLTAHSEHVETDAVHYHRSSRDPTTRIDYYVPRKRPEIQYLPAFGTTCFVFERKMFLIKHSNPRRPPPIGHRSYHHHDPSPRFAPTGEEPLDVLCLGFSPEPIKRFLDTCRDFAESQREDYTSIRASRQNLWNEFNWDTTILRPIRPLETVHMDPELKQSLVEDLENYLKPSTQKFYAS
jgi:mitochondrial chaperone BCS1